MESAEKKLRAVTGYDEHAPVTRSVRPQSYSASPSVLQFGSPDRFNGNSHSIDRLISAAQARILELFDGQGTLAVVARDIRAFLTELVGLHTGIYQIDLGLESFLDQLWEQGGFAELFRNTVRVTDSSNSIDELVTRAELAQDFTEIVRWYQRRIASLGAIESKASVGQLADQIFGFKVIHDRVFGGVSGMEVSCGIRCVGRSGQPLWLKVFVAHDEGYVSPADGWESWADVVENGSIREIRFAAIASLSHPWQKFIADSVNLFIPYEALDISPGRLDLQLEAVLFDERGNPLASAYRDELVSVVRASPQSIRARPMRIQPQALGVWASEFVYGNSIPRFEVCRRFDSGVHLGGRAIEAWYDLDLIGQHDKPITVEFCLVRADGRLVSNSKEHSPIVVRHIVHSVSPVTRLRSQGIAISLRHADVLDDDELFAELSVLDSEDRLLCGLVSPVVGALENDRQKSIATSVVDRKSVCTLRSMQVNPEEIFNQHRFVQVTTTLNLPVAGIEPWQLVVKILDEDGLLSGHDDVELIRSVWVAQAQRGHQCFDHDARVVTINFDQEQVLKKARLGAERKIKLQCQAQIFSARGLLVCEGLCPFALAVPEDGKTAAAPTAHPGAPVWIESVTFATVELSRVKASLALNFLHSSPESELVKIYYELVDSHGLPLTKTATINESPVSQPLPGNILTLHPCRNFSIWPMPRRWAQMNIDLAVNHPDEILRANGDVFFKLMLFSAHGHLEQVIRQPLPGSGLLSSSLAGAGENSLERLEDAARDNANSKKRRGFFAWH
jgi:hypothetical protein